MQRFTTTFSINFYCRSSKQNKKGEAPIEMGINILGSRFFITLDRKSKPGRLFKDAPTREYLSVIESRIQEWHTDCIKRGIQPTKQALCEFIRAGYKSPGKCLKSLYTGFFDSVEKRDITPSVKQKYHLAIDPFFKDLDMEQDASIVTKKMVEDYCCSITKSYKKSTVAGMLTKFKSIWLFARDNGYVDTNLFAGIKISKGLDPVYPLTEDELAKIENRHFDIERLERVRDIFLFSCYTGVAFCDSQSLQPDDFQTNSLGQVFIEKERAKTGVKYCVVIVPQALEIAKKYGYRFPRISNQKCNSYLAEIEDLCGIKKHLHFHLARHTAACLFLNRYHFSPEITAKILGHSLQVAQHYQKMWSSTLFEAFNAVLQ